MISVDSLKTEDYKEFQNNNLCYGMYTGLILRAWCYCTGDKCNHRSIIEPKEVTETEANTETEENNETEENTETRETTETKEPETNSSASSTTRVFLVLAGTILVAGLFRLIKAFYCKNLKW